MNITLYYKYLIHDVDQWTYRLAKVHIEDAMLRDDAQSTDIKSTDKSFYLRKIEDGAAHLGSHLAEELINAQPDANDVLNLSKASWTFSFKDDTCITASSSVCAELMHRFIVMHVLRDWSLLYAPDLTGTITSMLTEAEEAMDESLYMLELPIKTRGTKFTCDCETKYSCNHV